MSAVDTNFYEKKRGRTFYTSLVLLFLVIVSTIGLYIYNQSLVKKNTELSSNISVLQEAIDELGEDKNIQIYSIYSQHKKLIDRLGEMSKIPSMITHLQKTFSIYELQYKGFSYSNGTLQTELSVDTNDSGYAFKKIGKFLTNYRSLDEGALFDIEQVPSFSGYDRINFDTTLILK